MDDPPQTIWALLGRFLDYYELLQSHAEFDSLLANAHVYWKELQTVDAPSSHMHEPVTVNWEAETTHTLMFLTPVYGWDESTGLARRGLNSDKCEHMFPGLLKIGCRPFGYEPRRCRVRFMAHSRAGANDILAASEAALPSFLDGKSVSFPIKLFHQHMLAAR
jgi:hypothetical protein